MRANGKNARNWLGVLVGASALFAGCATEDAEDSGLREGTYRVTGLELGSCADDSWVASGTTTTSVVLEAKNDAFVVSACSGADGACLPSSPSQYAWNVDSWRGEDGGAFLAESGCLLVYVAATAQLEGNELVIEASRWSASGACTVDAVTAMRAQPCDGRTRLRAIAD